MRLRARLLRHPVGLAVRYLAGQRLRLAGVLAVRAVSVVIPMQLPVLVGALADALAGNAARVYGWTWPAGEAPAAVLAVGVALAALALAEGVLLYGRSALSAGLTRRFVTHVRRRLAGHLARLPLARQRAYGPGELMERFVGDAGALRGFVDRVFVQAPTNALRIVYPVAMLLWLDAALAAAVLAVVPVQALVLRWLRARLRRETRRARKARSALVQAAKEAVDGAEDAQALGAEAAVVDVAVGRADALERIQLTKALFAAGVGAAAHLFTGLGVALAWGLGGAAVLAGEMSLGALVTFTGFLGFAYAPARQMSRIAGTYATGLVSLERVHEILAEPVDPAAGAAAVRGALEADGLSAGYGGTPVVRGVRLRVAPGELVALVGPSGAGKSTLLRALARLEPFEGGARLGGQSLADLPLAAVRRSLALVPQRPVLFSLSVAANVRLAAPDATDAEVEAACRAARIHDVVAALPAGYATRLGVGGVALSGGQAQRLALARALVRRPAVLLLDEPTSALDGAAEAALVDALRAAADAGAAVLVSTHRPAAARAADRVVLLSEGQVEAEGTHAALLAASPLYFALLGAPDAAAPDAAAPDAAAHAGPDAGPDAARPRAALR